MEDLVQFEIYKIINENALKKFYDTYEEDILCDIFGNEQYFLMDYKSVGTSYPQEPYVHGTDWEIFETGIKDFVEINLREDGDFKTELDKITSKELKYPEDFVSFKVLTEFHFWEGMVSGADWVEEYETECYFVKVIY